MPLTKRAEPGGAVAGETRSSRRKLLIAFGGAASLVLWTKYSERLINGSSEASAGPLDRYRVRPESGAAQSCRAEVCTVNTARSGRAELRQLQRVRYIGPPEQWLLPEAGHRFANAATGALQWTTGPGNPKTGYAMEIRVVGDAPRAEANAPPQFYTAPEPGYVRAARLAGSGHSLLPDGRVVDAQGRAVERDAVRHYSALRFQGVPRTLVVELPPTSQGQPADGDQVRLQFDPIRGDLSALDRLPATAAAAQVIGVSTQTQPLRVMLRLDDAAAQNLLQSRVAVERATGEAAFPEQAVLEWEYRAADTEGVLAVPNSALVHDAQGLRLWVLVAGRAVPLAVRELRRTDQRSVVTEQPLTRGLAVRPADWRAMGSAARAAVFRAAGDGQRLLSEARVLIDKPATDLQPGQLVTART